MKIKDLKLAKYNPRKISDEALKRLCKSIKDFSGTVIEHNNELRLPAPIIINQRTGTVVGGHQRIKALQDLGQDFVNDADLRYVDCDEKTEMALNIALNNPKIQGEYDYPMLKDIIVELDTGDFDIEQTGFTEIEIKDMFDYVKPDGLDDSFSLSSEDKAGFQQMTFTLSDEQAEQVKITLAKSKSMGDFIDTGNENSNGNALARIAETFNGC